jgi:hypothetical protein
LSFETAGIGRFLATTTRFYAITPLLGSHLRLDRAGCVVYVPRCFLFVSAGVDLFLLSGRLWVGAAKGMSEVRRTKRFELKNGKLKTSALIKIQRYHEYYGGKATNQRAAAILKHSHAKLQGLLPRRLHKGTDALLDHLRVQLFL